jgi:hypothetical protein
MTAITSGDDHDLCGLIDELASFAGSYESESIEGVTSLEISKSTASIDGANCNAVVIPTSSVVTITDVDDDKSLMSAVVLVPSLLLACVLFATMLFLRRRRNRIADEEQERMLRPLREDEVEDDDIYGNRKYALNAVNVHKCHSAQCNSCNDSSKSTEFIPLENVSKWIEQRGEMKEEEVSLTNSSDSEMDEDKNLRHLESLKIQSECFGETGRTKSRLIDVMISYADCQLCLRQVTCFWETRQTKLMLIDVMISYADCQLCLRQVIATTPTMDLEEKHREQTILRGVSEAQTKIIICRRNRVH